MKASLLILFSFFFLNLSSQTIRYVKPVSSGSGDGSSWANASKDLQEMINAGVANDEVWVAAGIYKPTADINGNMNPGDPRTKTFVLKQGVKIYGGFNGTETTLSQKDFIANITILSGDIGVAGTSTDNSYHVITCNLTAFSAPTRLDGIRIQSGNANINGTDINGIFKSKGGGLFINGGSAVSLAEISVANCTFTNNFAFSQGGAAYLAYSISSFNNCTFSLNSSNIWGGAVAGFESDLPFTGCHFISNSSSGGGAIYNDEGKSIIQSCDFSFNNGVYGGAIIQSTGYPSSVTTSVIRNSVFVSNSASSVGGALAVGNQDMQVINCAFISNTAVNEGGAVHITTTGSNVSFYNCSLTRNTCTANAGYGAGLYYYFGAGGQIKNCILWNNTTPANTMDQNREEIFKSDNNLRLEVANSIVADYDLVNSININWGAGISTANPLFVNAADPDGADNNIRTPDDGLALQAGSPALNAGDNTAIPAGITTDISGLARVSGPAVDLGAYEKSAFCTPPSFTSCSANITVNTSPGQCSKVVTYTTLVSGSPFPNVSHFLSGATTGGGLGTGSGKVFNKGVTTVTIRAANSCYTATCVFTVTVLDNEVPTITCPAGNIIVSCPGDIPPPNTSLVTVADNCPGVVVTHSSDMMINQECDNHYTLIRTYRATDAAGNFAECSQTIFVDDQVAPTVTPPPPITVSCPSEVPAPDVNSVTITDNCGGPLSVRFMYDEIFNQTCANRYSIRRRYRGLDACENTRSCEQIITVDDQTPPVISCPAPLTVSCTGDVPAPDITAITASDNCTGGVTITHTNDVISEKLCDHRYKLTRTFRATDACGNFSECAQVITVDDQQPPVINCPAGITVTTAPNSCSANVSFNVPVTDNCIGPVTIASMPQSGSSFPIGTTTVTTRATDACGNMSTCTFNVTVVDGRLPVITEQPADLAVCETGKAVFSISATNAVTYQWQIKNGNSWEDIAGATASSFTISNVTSAMNNSEYRVMVTGPCTTVVSHSATLTINSLPAVSIFASGSTSLFPNESVDIHSIVNPTGGTFKWYLNGNILTGASGSSIRNITVDRTGAYKLEYTAPNGCSKSSDEIPVSALPGAKLWVYPNPNQGSFQVRYYNGVNEKLVMKIFNDAGQLIYTRVVNTSIPYTRIDVDLNGKVSQGIYILKLFREDGTLAGAVKVLIGHK